MKLIKRLLMAVSSILIILALASFFLPQKLHVERSVEISASAEKIYPHLADPKLFSQWSPWSKIDPNMKTTFIGAASGEGAGMSWMSDDPSVGSGSWKIIKAVENESLEAEMDFNGQSTATSFFKLKPTVSKTQVTWGFDTNAGMNPVMRWMGLMMDKMVGDEYAKGLAVLKQKIEK
jgi:uncharacterized protein YndB with AHSA1/START domain